MQITKNFQLSEFLKSTTADKKGYSEQYQPSPEVIENLKVLATDILQPFREKWDVPVKITSGYRCDRLNKAVGGVKSSAHTKGKAVDISTSGLSINEIERMITTLIVVGAKRIGIGGSFIHVDNDYKKPTPAVFTYSNTPKVLADKKSTFLKMIK